jgi:hypothetical protein
VRMIWESYRDLRAPSAAARIVVECVLIGR